MQAATPPRPGQPAPDFSLRGPGGQRVTLSEYRGQKAVVLVFYPLAFSPVCSHQLPAIQQALPRFEAQGAVVLGVSVDSWYANQAFAEQLGVTFPLLSDFFHEASLAYGVFLPERRTSGRALFVVDREGRIAWTDVAPTTAEVPSQDAALEALVALAPRA